MPGNGFLEHVLELMAAAGRIHARPMFGGYGIYLDGVMCALTHGDSLYLKSDENCRSLFTSRGLPAFCYHRGRRQIIMSYHLAPAECLEEPDSMQHWLRIALDAARRTRQRSGNGDHP